MKCLRLLVNIRAVIAIGLISISGIARGQVIISILFGEKLNTDKITFGLMLGNSWNSMSGYARARAQSNFNLGLFLNFKLNQRFFIQFDALAKYKTGVKDIPAYSLGDPVLDSMFNDGGVQRVISCLGLLPTIQYRFWKNCNLELGPQVLLRIKAKDNFTGYNESGDLKFEKDISSTATRFDFGVCGGASWQFNKGTGVKLSMRYYEGLVDVFHDDAGKNATRSVQVSVYLPVGREKKNRKKDL